MNLLLTPRLMNIYSHVNGPTAADIGTDHAYIPIELIKKAKCVRVIASDIRPGPAKIAGENIRKYMCADKIEVRTGAGLSVLSIGETDDIIIAGMGGILIRDIIAADMDKALSSRLVLQPMNSQYELRHYLIENGFKITCEDISVEGFKVYNLIVAEKGHGEPFECDGFYHLPPYLGEHKYFDKLYEKKMRELDKVINGIKESSDPDIEKLNKYQKWKKEISEFFSK